MRSALQALRLLSAEATGPAWAAGSVSARSTGSWLRALSSSSSAHMPAAASGDLQGALRDIDSVVSSETVSAKDIADAAVALTYLQATGSRRLWGKVFEKASTADFDATSLSSFLWAANTAGVGHFKTLFELAGPASKLLPSMTPTQLSHVVEGLGSTGAQDAALFEQVASQVTSKVGSFKAAELARVLWGYGAAGADSPALVAAVSKALVAKAGELSGTEAAQAVWALARLRRADKPTLDALVKAAKGKLESPVDAAGLAWALGYLGYQSDAATTKAIAGVLQAGAGELTPAHAVDAAWGLSLLGADKAAVSALLGTASKAIEGAPDSLDPYQVAAMFETAAASGATLSPQVAAYAAKMHALVEEGARGKRSAGLSAFKADLADAVARGMGARYRPEVVSKVKSFATTTPEGVHIDIAVTLDAQTKVAVEAVGNHYLSSAGTPLGPALSRSALLEDAGYKVVLVTAAAWAGLKSPVDKAKYVLAQIRSSAPNAAGKVDPLVKQLSQPFDPYA